MCSEKQVFSVQSFNRLNVDLGIHEGCYCRIYADFRDYPTNRVYIEEWRLIENTTEWEKLDDNWLNLQSRDVYVYDDVYTPSLRFQQVGFEAQVYQADADEGRAESFVLKEVAADHLLAFRVQTGNSCSMVVLKIPTSGFNSVE